MPPTDREPVDALANARQRLVAASITSPRNSDAAQEGIGWALVAVAERMPVPATSIPVEIVSVRHSRMPNCRAASGGIHPAENCGVGTVGLAAAGSADAGGEQPKCNMFFGCTEQEGHTGIHSWDSP